MSETRQAPDYESLGCSAKEFRPHPEDGKKSMKAIKKMTRSDTL